MGKRAPCAECNLVQPLWQIVWKFHKKWYLEPPSDPPIPLLGIYSRETKSVSQRDTCPSMFIIVLFTIASYGNSLSVNRWMDKDDVRFTHTHVYMYVYTYMYGYMVYVCIYICIHTNTMKYESP